jgi:hypothetical protein
MITRRILLRSSLKVLGGVATTLLVPQARAADARVRLAVVVGRNSSVGEVTLFDLKRLFMGEPVNAGGKRLLPLNLPPLSSTRVGFDRTVLGMSPDDVVRYWIDRKIRGDSGAPKVLDSADLIQRVVARLEGAIGYVALSELRPDVKLVRVDRKLPDDKGYPIAY